MALAATFFVARGFNQYREALAALPLDEMEQRIESASGFTPIQELPDLYLQAVGGRRRTTGSTPTRASTSSPPDEPS